MSDLKEQHICLKFFFWLGKNATETLEMLKVAFGEQRMGRTQSFLVVFQVHKWHVICWGWWYPSTSISEENLWTCWLSERCCCVVACQHYTTCYIPADMIKGIYFESLLHLSYLPVLFPCEFHILELLKKLLVERLSVLVNKCKT